MVVCGFIPIRLVKDDHNCEVNGVPLSEVIFSGTPCLEIHSVRDLAHDCAMASGIGYASGHLVDLSITVNMYLKSFEYGRVLTMSTWMSENLLFWVWEIS